MCCDNITTYHKYSFNGLNPITLNIICIKALSRMTSFHVLGGLKDTFWLCKKEPTNFLGSEKQSRINSYYTSYLSFGSFICIMLKKAVHAQADIGIGTFWYHYWSCHLPNCTWKTGCKCIGNIKDIVFRHKVPS